VAAKSRWGANHMTRGRNHDSLEAKERRLASWRAVRDDNSIYGLMAPQIIKQLEAEIAAAKANTSEGNHG
jgi:hypothetical protein